MRFKGFVVFFTVLALLTTGLFAQSAQVGTIAGTVKDATGAALPGVTVEIRSDDRGFTRSDVTDGQGRYTFVGLPLGRYTVTASLTGFQSVTSTGNAAELGRTTEVPFTLQLSAESAEITVTGEVPIVDPTNPQVQTTVTREQFEKAPVGRSYQTLFQRAPGVTGGSNPNVHGAPSSTNQYLFDNVDTTDPTTGTFGSNLNFEAIQEVNIYTSGVSAEYGRATGGIINVITKSGTNEFEGSAKYIATNDDWNEQNKTKNQVTGASLERVKFDQINTNIAATLGGPIVRDRAWFFGAYEKSEVTSAQRQTVDLPENFQQTTEGEFPNARLTFQITPTQNVWAKYSEDPLDGFVIDYWAGSQTPIYAGELEALTTQGQGGEQYAAQYSGIFGSNFQVEAFAAHNTSTLTVAPYQLSSLDSGAPHYSYESGLYYNGATFDGGTDRPRDQYTLALTHFRDLFGSSHDIKAGIDLQQLESQSQFGYPGNLFFEDESFDAATRTYVPYLRYNFDPVQASTSTGDIWSLYVRDKFKVGERLFLEAGLRYENQTGESDIGDTTVDASTIAPRLSGSWDLTGAGKSVIPFTAGRFYQYIIQGFSDEFANIPQQSNYDLYEWNGSAFEFVSRTEAGASGIIPNTDLDPTYMDEFTVGYQQQLGNTVGVGIRGIYRQWGDLIDDVIDFDSNGDYFRQIVNYEPAEREYRGVELTFEKRFANRWSALASYTWSEIEGNHFASYGTTLGDYVNQTCRTTADTTIGNNGTIPCSEVQDGANKFGLASYDRTHIVKGLASYTLPLGPVNLTLGGAGEWNTGQPYQKQRSVTVIGPAGPVTTATYFYNERGSDRMPDTFTIDGSVEATWRVFRTAEIGIKAESFNLTNEQEQINVNNLTWCDANTAACATARERYGTATARGSFQAPRSYRVTGLIRF